MSTLWYTKPAEVWEEALPLGNGRLGGMVSGNLREERIQVNEETIWYGGWEDRLNPDAKENLPKLRQLIREGRISEAEHLIRLAFISGPDGQRGYQTLGDIEMKYGNDPSPEECTAYRRELDLDRAVCRVQYENAEKETFERTCFISRPADCMVLHLRAPKGKVSVEGMLNRAKYFDRTGKVNDHTIYLSGNLGKNALEFAMCLSAKATGGRVYTMGHTLVIEEAEKITEKLERAMAQSREHKIILLPALPKAWDHGEVNGLRLVGNASIALAWENGKLTRCAVTADQAYEGEVVYGEMRQAVKLEKGETVMLDAVLQLLES